MNNVTIEFDRYYSYHLSSEKDSAYFKVLLNGKVIKDFLTKKEAESLAKLLKKWGIMIWIYLGILLNIISVIYLSYLDYKDGYGLTIGDFIATSIISSLPYIAFILLLYQYTEPTLDKIDFNKIVIKGKKNDITP